MKTALIVVIIIAGVTAVTIGVYSHYNKPKTEGVLHFKIEIRGFEEGSVLENDPDLARISEECDGDEECLAVAILFNVDSVLRNHPDFSGWPITVKNTEDAESISVGTERNFAYIITRGDTVTLTRDGLLSSSNPALLEEINRTPSGFTLAWLMVVHREIVETVPTISL